MRLYDKCAMLRWNSLKLHGRPRFEANGSLSLSLSLPPSVPVREESSGRSFNSRKGVVLQSGNSLNAIVLCVFVNNKMGSKQKLGFYIEKPHKCIPYERNVYCLFKSTKKPFSCYFGRNRTKPWDICNIPSSLDKNTDYLDIHFLIASL